MRWNDQRKGARAPGRGVSGEHVRRSFALCLLTLHLGFVRKLYDPHLPIGQTAGGGIWLPLCLGVVALVFDRIFPLCLPC